MPVWPLRKNSRHGQAARRQVGKDFNAVTRQRGRLEFASSHCANLTKQNLFGKAKGRPKQQKIKTVFLGNYPASLTFFRKYRRRYEIFNTIKTIVLALALGISGARAVMSLVPQS